MNTCCICGGEIKHNWRNQHGTAKTCGPACTQKRKTYLKGKGWSLFVECKICGTDKGQPCFDDDEEIKIPCEGRQKKLITKKCKHCKCEFTTRSMNAIFCDLDCTFKFHRAKRKKIIY